MPSHAKLSFLCCSANSHYGLRSISLSNTVLFWNRMVAVYSIHAFICHYAGKFEQAWFEQALKYIEETKVNITFQTV
jgi:hypothetical protein